ncbi:DUF3048 domain-containing protein [Candidatus Uhrbacteria bacterium]|nr:DUF3048 domain-containing protein [Candidatus Uhrbacteria bacterium]
MNSRSTARRTHQIIIIGTLVLLGGGAFAYRAWRSYGMRAPSLVERAVERSGSITRRWLDGAPIPDGVAQPAAVSVVMDNAPEARPPAGLAAASLVFEVPVEGRRTRFLAVYALPTPSNDGAACEGCPATYAGPIGPVRSARPYCVGIADAIGAPLVHVGGSTAALSLLKSRRHVNQYFDPPFERDRSRPAPFNVFTSLAGLAGFVSERGWTDELQMRTSVRHRALWPFADRVDNALDVHEGRTIHLAFSRGERAFVVDWEYDESGGVYIRSAGGAPHRDRDGARITAKNVVVLTVKSDVLDEIGRLRIAALEPPIGASFEGFIQAEMAVVYRDGQRVSGRWSWEDAPSDAGLLGLRQMRDTESGEPEFVPIPLAPGTTWVEVVDWNVEL